MDKNEPLSGLIEFAAWDESGRPLPRFRYYSVEAHKYSNGQTAGELDGDVYRGPRFESLVPRRIAPAALMRICIRISDDSWDLWDTWDNSTP